MSDALVGEINRVPWRTLDRLNANQAVLVCNEDLGQRVLATTTFDPSALQEVPEASHLAELRRREGVSSITLTLMRLTPQAIADATSGFGNRFRILAELNSMLSCYRDVALSYVITHYNYAPLNELTVFIGGDCYRTGSEIHDLFSVMTRTRDLAHAMLRKAVLVFPDIPALHGGKKGEWIVLDRDGDKIDGLSEEAIVALGTLIIPKGIEFVNRYKELAASDNKIISTFPDRYFVRPDTASPDVVSGPNWRTMCSVWATRGVDLSQVTCLPAELGGPLIESSVPTAFGVVAVAKSLLLACLSKQLANTRFLLEALGGVGHNCVRGLLEKGARPSNILAFDRSASACKSAADQFGIDARAMSHSQFYERLDGDEQFDVWINNGEGDNTTSAHVSSLLNAGIRLFVGAANNLFKVTEEDQCRQQIFDAGGWVWPDPAASAGGWTLAAVDLFTRAQGRRSDTESVEQLILDTIWNRNERLVESVVAAVTSHGPLVGESLWAEVKQIIDGRVGETLALSYAPAEIRKLADTNAWKLV